MKICFVNNNKPNLFEPKQQFPLALLYVAAVAKKILISSWPYASMSCGDVSIVDLADKNNERDWETLIPRADLYGFSSTYLDYPYCVKIAKRIKKMYPVSKIIIGGAHPTTCPSDLDSIFDTAVIGEGEDAIVQIMLDFKKGMLKPIYKMPLIENLDDILFPARELLDDDSLRANSSFAFGKTYKKGGATSIITSRGCPFSCSFCSGNGIWGRRVRFRSVEDVIWEIKEIIGRYNIRQFRFQDDHFSLNRDRFKNMCEELAKLDITFRASARVDNIDVEMLKLFKKAGAKELGYGIESADQKVLNLLCKGTTVEQNENAVRLTQEAGIDTRLFLMVGTPGETSETIDKNIEFLEKMKPKIVTFSLFHCFPGSAIWDNPERFGCKIISRNSSKYCMNLSPNKIIEPTIVNDGLSIKQMIENGERIKKYIFEKGIGNLGQ